MNVQATMCCWGIWFISNWTKLLILTICYHTINILSESTNGSWTSMAVDTIEGVKLQMGNRNVIGYEYTSQRTKVGINKDNIDWCQRVLSAYLFVSLCMYWRNNIFHRNTVHCFRMLAQGSACFVNMWGICTFSLNIDTMVWSSTPPESLLINIYSPSPWQSWSCSQPRTEIPVCQSFMKIIDGPKTSMVTATPTQNEIGWVNVVAQQSRRSCVQVGLGHLHAVNQFLYMQVYTATLSLLSSTAW